MAGRAAAAAARVALRELPFFLDDAGVQRPWRAVVAGDGAVEDTGDGSLTKFGVKSRTWEKNWPAPSRERGDEVDGRCSSRRLNVAPMSCNASKHNLRVWCTRTSSLAWQTCLLSSGTWAKVVQVCLLSSNFLPSAFSYASRTCPSPPISMDRRMPGARSAALLHVFFMSSEKKFSFEIGNLFTHKMMLGRRLSSRCCAASAHGLSTVHVSHMNHARSQLAFPTCSGSELDSRRMHCCRPQVRVINFLLLSPQLCEHFSIQGYVEVSMSDVREGA